MLSKKQKNAISMIGVQAINEVLDMKFLRYSEDFHLNNPETWSDDEKRYFDSLNELEMKITGRIIELLDSKKTRTARRK